MKALTLKPWWAVSVWFYDKTIELRTWKTDYRGPLVIHSSRERAQGYFPNCALCVVDLLDVRPAEVSDWDAAFLKKGELTKEMCKSLYSWVFGEVKTIYPIKCKGKQGLWEFDHDIEYYDDPGPGEQSDADFEKIWLPYMVR